MSLPRALPLRAHLFHISPAAPEVLRSRGSMQTCKIQLERVGDVLSGNIHLHDGLYNGETLKDEDSMGDPIPQD
jgi:hypothetical protein